MAFVLVMVSCSSLSESGQGGDTAGLRERRRLTVAFVDADGGDRAIEVRKGAEVRFAAFNERDPIIALDLVDAAAVDTADEGLVAALVVGDDLSAAEGLRASGVSLLVISSRAALGEGAWRSVAGPDAVAAAMAGVDEGVLGEDAVAEGLANGSRAICACTVITGDESRAAGDFVDGYEAANNSAPGLWSAEGYDSAGLVVEAVRLAFLDRMGIDGYLRSQPTPYVGVTKPVRFGSDGELTDQPVFVIEASGDQLSLSDTITGE